LRLYLGGPGGTGKSRVIAALNEYFNAHGEAQRLRLASFTGIAAKNINGTTLHTALTLNQGQKNWKVKGKMKTDLIAMWLGVDYLFVDEVSMTGCKLLLQIHEALVDAKGCTEPFDGISVIFAGDFAQLPPVSQTKIFSQTKSTKEAVVFRQLLWRSITTVVMLTEQMRQAGPENQQFVEMLSRLRDGRCNQDDYELLNTRLLRSALDNVTRTQWQEAPMIVYTNTTRMQST
jgi:ATP-dependent exoDNAse (exonuclease V) alpha subunit